LAENASVPPWLHLFLVASRHYCDELLISGPGAAFVIHRIFAWPTVPLMLHYGCCDLAIGADAKRSFVRLLLFAPAHFLSQVVQKRASRLVDITF